MRARLRALDDSSGRRHRVGAGDDVPRRGPPPAVVLLAACRRQHRMGAARHQVRGRRPVRQPGRPSDQHRRRARPRRRNRVGQGVFDQPGGLTPTPSPRSVATSHSTRRRSRPSTRGTRRSRPAATAQRCWTSTTYCCTPPPRSRTTRRSRRSSATGTAASSSTNIRTSRRCSSGCSTRGSASRDDLTVVGDANQTIYSFTGATPQLSAGFLASIPRRRGGPPGARLPVHPAGGVAGQPGHRRRARPDGRQQAAPGRPA